MRRLTSLSAATRRPPISLVKMDGGLDLNSQMCLGPTNGFDRRDNRPGYVSDVWLGYEQAL